MQSKPIANRNVFAGNSSLGDDATRHAVYFAANTTMGQFNKRFPGCFVQHSHGRVFVLQALLWQGVIAGRSLHIPSTTAAGGSIALPLKPLFPLFFWLQIGPSLALPVFEQNEDITLGELRDRLVREDDSLLRRFLPSQLRQSRQSSVDFSAPSRFK